MTASSMRPCGGFAAASGASTGSGPPASRRGRAPPGAPPRLPALATARPRVGGPLRGRVLAGSERPRVAAEALERDEATLAREDMRLVGLEIPERAKAHRVHADKADVPDAREEGRRSLCERTERGPGAGEGVLGLGVHAPDLADDGREDELDRLDRIEPAVEDHAAQRRVDVLRVAAAARERDAERRRLVAQARDGVDLAVVRECRERLHALEARRRVRRVAVVPERHRRLEAWIREVGEVRLELLRMPAQLVHGRAPREAHDRRSGRPLDVDAGVVEAASRAARRSLDLERELPEAGLTLPRARAERGAARVAMALEEHADAVLREDAPGLRLDELVVARRDEDVRHGEARVERDGRVEPRRAERVGPELARDVGQDAGAVALAVDRAGAVREALQPADRLREDLSGRRAVLARDRDQGTGVALVVHGGTLSTEAVSGQVRRGCCSVTPTVTIRLCPPSAGSKWSTGTSPTSSGPSRSTNARSR